MKILPAPLAGYTDYAFRKLLTECGAAEVWTEMISAAALAKSNPKTVGMLKTVDGVRNTVQLFGNSPGYFTDAIKGGLLCKFDEININMGCPAPKIAKDGGGCSLMRNLAAAKKIITACRTAISSKPASYTVQPKLSVKFRLGWNKNIAVHFARMCEECGADRLVIHGRLGTDGYSGTADWLSVAQVVRAVKTPVIANGDITDGETAKKCLTVTGADGVMIGRGLLGHPWRINPPGGDTAAGTPAAGSMRDGDDPAPEEIKRIILRHIELFETENAPFPEFKKHALFYCNALHTGKQVKQAVAAAADMSEIKRLLRLDK
jgi:tRNA-dihydrouridine synthase B